MKRVIGCSLLFDCWACIACAIKPRATVLFQIADALDPMEVATGMNAFGMIANVVGGRGGLVPGTKQSGRGLQKARRRIVQIKLLVAVGGNCFNGG
jgi:hypothetical protein